MKKIILLILIVGIWGVSFCSYSAEPAKVRSSPLAGSWYPADPEELRKMLKGFLEQVQVPKSKNKILALISPHAGYRFSGKGAGYGFKTVEGKNFERVIIIGPSHRGWFRGICVSSFDYYETPLGKVPVEREIGEALLEQKIFVTNPNAEALEHSLEMEIPFLQAVIKDFKIIPLMVGEMKEEDYPAAAEALKPYITEKTLIVVSSDFTHYGRRFGYRPFTENVKENLKKLDLGAIDLIVKKDFKGYQKYVEETGATICGRNAIGILLHLLPADAQGTLLNYYTSGDLLNDYSSSVSYASIVFKK